jgi:hypothetical protein
MISGRHSLIGARAKSKRAIELVYLFALGGWSFPQPVSVPLLSAVKCFLSFFLTSVNTRDSRYRG